ncbi:helix-turn-helix transcriptional regulator [Bradyrhizobium sp. LLZ17]|uniref:Helix-turn-helix transcriptional regulator n=1 Tax=Bradyrhizobium sp. LLZ17 TaxID=3239388 RepID=A0AB39XFQ4_9BRAD
MPATTSDLYLKTRQVQHRYGGCSHMFIERRLKNDPTFPRPVFMGRLRFWKLSELEQWEQASVERAEKAVRQ